MPSYTKDIPADIVPGSFLYENTSFTFGDKVIAFKLKVARVTQTMAITHDDRRWKFSYQDVHQGRMFSQVGSNYSFAMGELPENRFPMEPWEWQNLQREKAEEERRVKLAGLDEMRQTKGLRATIDHLTREHRGRHGLVRALETLQTRMPEGSEETWNVTLAEVFAEWVHRYYDLLGDVNQWGTRMAEKNDKN